MPHVYVSSSQRLEAAGFEFVPSGEHRCGCEEQQQLRDPRRRLAGTASCSGRDFEKIGQILSVCVCSIRNTAVTPLLERRENIYVVYRDTSAIRF